MRFVIDRDWNGVPAPRHVEMDVTPFDATGIVRTHKPDCKCEQIYWVNKESITDKVIRDIACITRYPMIVCACVGHIKDEVH